MTYMLEVLYKSPADDVREGAISETARKLGGSCTYREVPGGTFGPVCLTFEFDTIESAETAARQLREAAYHVEGPMDYGDSIGDHNVRPGLPNHETFLRAIAEQDSQHG